MCLNDPQWSPDCCPKALPPFCISKEVKISPSWSWSPRPRKGENRKTPMARAPHLVESGRLAPGRLVLLSPPPCSASTANASDLEPFLICPLSDAGSQGQCPGVSLVSSRNLVTLYAPIRRGGERERGGGAQEGASLWNPAGGAVQSPVNRARVRWRGKPRCRWGVQGRRWAGWCCWVRLRAAAKIFWPWGREQLSFNVGFATWSWSRVLEFRGSEGEQKRKRGVEDWNCEMALEMGGFLGLRGGGGRSPGVFRTLESQPFCCHAAGINLGTL